MGDQEHFGNRRAAASWGDASTLSVTGSRGIGDVTVGFEGTADFVRRYSDAGLLGRGGMGEVHLHQDRRLRRQVAMKRMRRTDAMQDRRMRFVREARIQAQLEHPAVVPVYDLGVDPDGTEFLTMKRVSGTTLEEILRSLAERDEKALAQYSRHRLLAIFRQVCLCIEYAHAKGVIHRDIKPSNVIVGEFGEVYVLDWGLALVVTPDSVEVNATGEVNPDTLDGHVLGTPGYMAPEQLYQAHLVDERADVYALATMFFELLTHRHLHEGDSVRTLIRSTQVGADARGSVRAPEMNVPPELERACVRGTSLEPRNRYRTVRELREAVDAFLEGDRDLEVRRDLAVGHVEKARLAMRRALESGPEADDARVLTLQEAGRAVALDPSSPEAVEIVTSMIAHPPTHVPPEVTAEIEAADRASSLALLRFGAVAYGALFAFGLMFALSTLARGTLRNPPSVAAMLAPLGLAAAACWYGPQLNQRLTSLLVAVFSSAAVAGTAIVGGPFMLVPAFSVANVVGLLAGPAPTRIFALSVGCAALLLPFVLEPLGWLPVSYVYESHRVLALAGAIGWHPVYSRLWFLLASVAAVLAPAFVLWRLRDRLDASRRQLHLYAWNLRHMAPGGLVRGTATSRGRP